MGFSFCSGFRAMWLELESFGVQGVHLGRLLWFGVLRLRASSRFLDFGSIGLGLRAFRVLASGCRVLGFRVTIQHRRISSFKRPEP